MKLRRTLLSSWLLICLLLAGQFALLVHEAGHTKLTSAAAAPCVFCLSHSNFDGAAPAQVIAVAADPVGSSAIEYRAPALPSLSIAYTAGPRAPPRIS